MMDSSRVISSERNDTLCIWLADNGHLLHTYSGPSKCVRVTNNMKYAVSGPNGLGGDCPHSATFQLATNADTSLKIWSLNKDDEKYTVSHSEEITCFVLTMDSQYVITGSRDMSLKVWQVTGGKLSQVMNAATELISALQARYRC